MKTFKKFIGYSIFNTNTKRYVQLNMEFDINKLRLEFLLNLFEGQKWRDVEPFVKFRPEDEKYINKEALLKIIDEQIGI